MTRPRGTVVLDLDGVVYLDGTGVPGAGAALDEMVGDGWHLLFATNNSTKLPSTVVDHLRVRTGHDTAPEQVVTSTMAAVRYVGARHTSALVVGPPALSDSLRAAGVRLVDTPDPVPGAVVVGLDLDIDYGHIDRAARAVRGGAEFVATNVDPTYPTPTGLSPGAGAIVSAVATAAGRDPVSCGKPSDLFGALVRDRIVDGTVWMVGDRLDTDIGLAIRNGWRSILVLTGVTSEGESIPDEFTPDHIVPSIVDVPALIRDAGRR
jgi:glycerol-1-phosphatase